ncbi:GTP 3',8-cyclase MoaA [Alicyclobacillus ferrooxydans]|uniref:GTP 3',8-cyclase n=1 Tax=Alicyclobacillus ferrooxydans TaxID=471514 RepID=A0A0P9ELQ4_9BACL|nr:GTP 3',8-cyclase MoaA [Alicyclobacillus ferrooxydans]KPV44228.1 cyclic pyranopterin monophosphate synthase [Alicyclobacillus ferrooxydans]
MSPSNETTGLTARPLMDTLGRALVDLRISVTDRCNFRCRYCMPREVFGPDFAFLPHEDLLTFEEIVRLSSVFAKAGVKKLRITGGEPLLRRDLEQLIAMLAKTPGIQDIALTTNGSLLTQKRAQDLKEAGLRRVTVSLDSLRDEVFMAMNDVRFPVQKVLEAIRAAEAAGLAPVKINMVVKRGVNEQDVLEMAEYFRGSGHIVRYIEYMDVGNSNGWRMDDVVPASEILERIHAKWPLHAIAPHRPGEVATRYVYDDGGGEIGIIASVTRAFCGTCTRARLSPEGQLFTCLFSGRGHDFRARLRRGETDEQLFDYLASIWNIRRDRYSEMRTEATHRRKKVEMSHIGG